MRPHRDYAKGTGMGHWKPGSRLESEEKEES